MNSKKNLLLGQGLMLTLASVFLAVISFLKEAILARQFGVSYMSDAYTIAIQVPEILFAVVWETVGVVVIPLYTSKLHAEGKQGAQRFFSNILTAVGIISLLFILCGEFLGNYLISFLFTGVSPEVYELAVSLLRWVFPILFFEGIIRVVTGILNVHKQFLIPRILNAVRNLGVIIFLLLFTNKFGIYAAVIGFLTGMIIESFLCLLSMRKHEHYTLRLDLKDPALKTVLTMTLPLLVSVGIQEVNQLVDKVIASFLETGTIASLNYASKLSGMIQVTLLGSIAVLLYPRYSKLAAEEKNRELAETYSKSVGICIIFGLPLIFGGIFLRQELVSIAFEGGTFDRASVIAVSSLFALYLAGSVFLTITGVSVKLFAACCDTKIPAITAAIGVAVNVVFNLLLTYFWGAIGLAAATTISTVTVCILLFFIARKKIYKFSLKPTVTILLKCLVFGIIMFIGLHIFKHFAMDAILSLSGAGQLIYTALAVVLGAGIYGGLLIITKTAKNDLSFIVHRKDR